MSERKPIGYWLKELDRLIEQNFDHALAGEDVTRREWQVLNVLSVAPTSSADLTDALRPFFGTGAGASASESAPEEVLDRLTRRGWALRDAETRYALSPEGEAARSALLERVQALRGAIADGVTPEAYNTTIDTLQRMATNLGQLSP